MARAGNGFAIRRESHITDPVLMAHECRQFFSSRIPELDRAIGAGGCDLASVCGKFDVPDGVTVAFQFSCFFWFCFLPGPKFDRLVGAGCGQCLAVARKGDLVNCLFMRFDRLDNIQCGSFFCIARSGWLFGGLGSRCQIPDQDCAIFTSRGKVLAIGSDGNATAPSLVFCEGGFRFLAFDIKNDDLAIVAAGDQSFSVGGDCYRPDIAGVTFK